LSRKPGKVQRKAFKGDVLPDNGANGAHGAQKHEADRVRGPARKIMAFNPFFVESGGVLSVSLGTIHCGAAQL
jgi:hypothetical protein